MLRVGIFLMMTGRQAGGPETYERCLVESLMRVDADAHYTTYSHSRDSTAYLPSAGERLVHRVLGTRSRVFGTAVALPLMLVRDRIDLLHAPFTPPPLSSRPYVFTHHCFSSFNHPEFYAPHILLRLNALIKKGLRSARRIICVSQCTLDLTADLFHLDRERMHVVHNGVAPQYRPQAKAAARAAMAERHGLQRPYLLYVGKLETRKNIVRLLEAFDRFRRETRDDALLVLAGARSPMSVGIDETIERLRLVGDVREMGYVPDADLPALYGGARMFVFPSLWEGFGIPAIEAMACGTPVLTSNLSALPEVCGDAALLVDPYDPDDIARGMLRLWRDGPLADTLVERGLRNARRFDWDRTARATAEVYREAALA
jgi:glycosyltransferase involved in cell wall biosynthesis